MTRYLILGVCALCIVLSSCAGGLGLTEEQKLERELKKWESFSGSGIIEVSALGMSLRKPFNIAKSMKQMRLDVIDGGVFGANASPLMSMYLGDYLAVNAPIMPALEMLNLKDKIPEAAIALFSSTDYLMQKYGAEIIANKAIVRDDLKVNFKKNYQLDSVVDAKSGATLVAAYTARGALDALEIKSGKMISAKLIFDTVDYSTPEIIPLPQKEQAAQGLMDIFQGGGMMDLLKNLINGNE